MENWLILEYKMHLGPYGNVNTVSLEKDLFGLEKSEWYHIPKVDTKVTCYGTIKMVNAALSKRRRKDCSLNKTLCLWRNSYFELLRGNSILSVISPSWPNQDMHLFSCFFFQPIITHWVSCQISNLLIFIFIVIPYGSISAIKISTIFWTLSLYQAIVSIFYRQYFLSTEQIYEASIALILQKRRSRHKWSHCAKISQLVREEEDSELSSHSQHIHTGPHSSALYFWKHTAKHLFIH